MPTYAIVPAMLFCVVLSTSTASAQSRVTPATSRGTNLPRVDLNSGPETALASLPGIGEALAKKIVAARPYTTIDELAKTGMTPTSIERLRPFVTVGAELTAKSSEGPIRGTLTGSGMTPVPVESGGIRAVPVPAGNVKTVTVPSGVVQKVEAGPGAIAVDSAKLNQSASASLVWVDTTKKVFYRQGSASYGKKEPGQYMAESTAVAAGYREATQKAVPAKKGSATSPAQQKQP